VGELGRRLRRLRYRFSLSVAELACIVGLRHHQIEELEEEGVASAHVLFELLAALSATDRLAVAFVDELSFATRSELLARAGLPITAHTLWRGEAARHVLPSRSKP
jgi:transcriptional regulator with XRE-family HTH domain